LIADWEAISSVGEVPCAAGEFFQGYDPGKDGVSDGGTQADTGSFAVCKVVFGTECFMCLLLHGTSNVQLCLLLPIVDRCLMMFVFAASTSIVHACT
jgi:hypothetical protein